eukprot:CAMPEP_0206373184 /NCGR_PEP_ID=MMETSP0294-20121207/7555_1 /ASSEMBLY_ACC=CAM_ASM_000327 /TAXON_ID=39354 /ORGANISM="Heterosigma akashiwo, Strain CCMP2393" /LENGTH=152 /DNA_ID=CAMNT_0053820709 /DNA_START=77 /DNA_END=531 /DNA_ORIENTATION=+
MKILEKQPRKVVLSYSRKTLKASCAALFVFLVTFILLDAKHPKASLACVRHQVDLDQSEASKDSLEDNDCELVVRPTRTVFDTHVESEVYSFEVVGVALQVISGVSNTIIEENANVTLKDLMRYEKRLKHVPGWTVWLYNQIGLALNDEGVV